LPVAVLVVVVIGASLLYGAKMRGVADAHIEQARQDSVVADSLRLEADELRGLADARQAALVALEREAGAERARDSVELASLRRQTSTARQATLGAIADLPPEVMVVVLPVIESFEAQILLLERQVVEVEGQRDTERERARSALATATTWMASSLGYERTLNARNAENANLRAAIEAQRQALGSGFGLSLRVGWWMLPVGAAIGIAVASAF